MGSSWDTLAWDDVAIHVANKKPNACHNEQEVIFFVMYHLGKMMATVVICALCSITAVIAQTYPPIKPYSSNSNSTKFPTFACTSDFQTVGGIGYEYWRTFEYEYSPLEDYSVDAALEYAKENSKTDVVLKNCKPSTSTIKKGVTLRNAVSSVTGDGDYWTDRFNQFLLQLTMYVPCSQSTMKKLKNVKYPKTSKGYLIPLKAYYEEDYPDGVDDPPLLMWVVTDVDFSPGVKPLKNNSSPGFPQLVEPEQPSNCTCPYGKKTTTKSCTLVPSFEDSPFFCVYVNTTINPDAGLIRWKPGNCTSTTTG